jgi:hypothetical protein
VAVCATATAVIATREPSSAVTRTVPFRYVHATERQYSLEYETSAAVRPALDDCTADDLQVNTVRRDLEPVIGLRAKPDGRSCALSAITPVVLVGRHDKTLTPVNVLPPGYHEKIALRPGQYAVYTVHWAYNCDPAFMWGATALLRMPGGVLRWEHVPAPDRCLRDTPDKPYELGGWRAVHPPSQVPWSNVRVRLDGAPSTIHAGQTIRFAAVLENPDDKAVVLAPCPAYIASLAVGLDHADDEFGDRVTIPGSQVASLLNCRDSGRVLQPHSTTAFRMVLRVPSSYHFDEWASEHVTSKGYLSWWLGGSSERMAIQELTVR